MHDRMMEKDLEVDLQIYVEKTEGERFPDGIPFATWWSLNGCEGVTWVQVGPSLWREA